MPQTNLPGRVVRLLNVQKGNVYTADVGDLVWSSPTNATTTTPPLIFTGVVDSFVLNQKVFFCDGSNYCYYDALLDTVFPWVATKGTLPKDAQNNTPRLGCNWRNRPVMAGLFRNPQSWFMGRKDTFDDWDYGAVPSDPTMAVSGVFQAPQGLISESIMSLCPWSDDVLIAFCASSIYMFAGDPADGGDIQMVSRSVGGTFGKCWAMLPDGSIIFFSNHTGLYRLVPGGKPEPISAPIDPLLRPINTGTNFIRAEYDPPARCVHFFVSPLGAQGAATHYVFETRTGSFFQEVLPDAMNPLASCVVDGNTAQDRVLATGSWDGYVRFFDPDATTDDGTAISSEVLLGPVISPTFAAMMVRDLVADLGLDSGDVTYQLLTGTTAEEALAATPKQTGTWKGGRNPSSGSRACEHAVYVRVTSTNPWAFERMRAVIGETGPVRARGR